MKTSVVATWPRVTLKRISPDVRAVAQGAFDFSRLEHLMAVSDEEDGETSSRTRDQPTPKTTA